MKLEQCKVDQGELSIVKSQNADLQAIITGKDKTISLLDDQVQNQRSQISNYELQGSNYQAQVAILNKSLKRQKSRTVVVGILGFLSTVGVILLL